MRRTSILWELAGGHVMLQGGPEVLRVPGWQAYPWLRAGFSTRHAGESEVYGAGELNLGWTGEDDAAKVTRNRAAFVKSIAGGPGMELVTVGQVHGAIVRDLSEEAEPWMTAEGRATLEGDGLVSALPGRLLAILTADCVPVLVADTRTHAVGAFHAGWRGTLSRIAQLGVERMQQRYGSQVKDLVAAIGPSIRVCCFEVGEEVLAQFAAEFADAAQWTVRGERARGFLDLVEANRRQLLEAGLQAEAVQIVGGCTACAREADDRRRFYSYRAEGGRCGRMLSAIGAVA